MEEVASSVSRVEIPYAHAFASLSPSLSTLSRLDECGGRERANQAVNMSLLVRPGAVGCRGRDKVVHVTNSAAMNEQ